MKLTINIPKEDTVQFSSLPSGGFFRLGNSKEVFMKIYIQGGAPTPDNATSIQDGTTCLLSSLARVTPAKEIIINF